jgi:site-specific DNA-methyltransferase (adenine-specific)
MSLTITNEDNMELMARYPDNYFDLAIVDPPYGIGEDGGKSESRCKKTKVKPSNYKKKNWDNAIPNDDYFIELKRVSKHVVIWGANHFIENIPYPNSPCWIVWDKDNGENDFADCELAYCDFNTAVRKIRYKWHGMLQEKMGNSKEKRIHPTQKPIDLYKWILDKYAKQGDKILDTHLGSGSIAIACHDYGFELTCCELDKEYFDKAMERINNHTNQTKLF